MNSLRIAVTGGAGRIGRVTCKLLASLGHELVVLDRRVPEETFGRFVFVNLEDRFAVQPALEGCDAVIHLGEIPGAMPYLQPNDLIASNVRACGSVMQSAAELKIKRAIYVSTCQVYGMWGGTVKENLQQVLPKKLPLTEDEPVKPINCYAASKAMNEIQCRQISATHGLPIAMFRLPATFEFTRDPQQLKWWKRSGDDFGEGFWTYLLAEDAARAFQLAIDHPRPGCEAYHLVAKHIFGTMPLRERIAKHYPNCPPLPASWRDTDAPVDCGKAREHFGWEAKLDINDLLKEPGT